MVREIREEVDIRKDTSEIKIFMRIKPWEGQNICVNI
jgi:hypothetical protein